MHQSGWLSTNARLRATLKVRQEVGVVRAFYSYFRLKYLASFTSLYSHPSNNNTQGHFHLLPVLILLFEDQVKSVKMFGGGK